MVVKADASGATENSVLADGMAEWAMRWIAGLGRDSGLKTGGYVPTAPAFRGTVDMPSNVKAESGRLVLRTPLASAGDGIFAWGMF